MTSSTPRPPAGIPVRVHPPLELEAAARLLADLIAEAREEGLITPESVSIYDYAGDGPEATMRLPGRDNSNWHHLARWAERHRTDISTHRAYTPGTVRAAAEFRLSGIKTEITATIDSPAEDDDS